MVYQLASVRTLSKTGVTLIKIYLSLPYYILTAICYSTLFKVFKGAAS